MAIETLSDIIQELADKIGIYNSHGEGEKVWISAKVLGAYHCRTCFETAIRQRIEAACKIESIMRRVKVLADVPDYGVRCSKCAWHGKISQLVRSGIMHRICPSCGTLHDGTGDGSQG